MCAVIVVDSRPASAAGGEILWQEEFDRNGQGQGSDIPNGIAAEGGRVYLAVGGIRYLVRVYDGGSGALLWQDELDVTQYSSEATAVAVDKGRVFVAGYRRGHSSRDFLVRAYDGKTGGLLWEDLFDYAGLEDAARVIAVDNGRVYVGGIGTLVRGHPGLPENAPMLVRAYDAQQGTLLWQEVYDVGAESQSHQVTSIAAEKGRVYVATGWSSTGSTVRAYDGDSGVLLWQDQRQDAGVQKIAVKDGRVYAAGSRRNGNVYYFWVRAYDGGAGSLFWEDFYLLNGNDSNGAADVAIDHGLLFVVGYLQRGDLGPGETTEFLVRAYEAMTGQFRWQDSFHGLANRTNVALAVDAGEPASSPGKTVKGKGVYAAGFITSEVHNTEFVVRAYEEKSGALLWKDETSRLGLDAAFVVAAEKGRVYAAGYTNADTFGKLFIRAYDAK